MPTLKKMVTVTIFLLLPAVVFAQTFPQRPVTWIDVEGLGDAKTIERFGELFGLHRLALEVLGTGTYRTLEDAPSHMEVNRMLSE